jgi:hypothetical protein
MNGLLITCLMAIGLETVVISLLMVMPKLGYLGKNISENCAKAPTLDLVVGVLTWFPWLIGSFIAGWRGFVGSVLGQIIVMQLWIFIHEATHQNASGGPRIVGYLNQRFGWWRNHLGLWITAIALPVFFAIRFAQVCIYPFLIWLLGFPNYKHSDWINVSRQKFEGLVGHDLLWCWYCDWMTGVYALGAEMLRNVESFWCPIRFYDDKKCENCKIDFPDIEGGWVAADGTMKDVVETLDEHMSEDRNWSWFGHPARQRTR